MGIDNSFANLVNDIAKEVFDKVQEQIANTVATTVSRRIADEVSGNLIGDLVSQKINSGHLTILEGMIPGSAVNPDTLRISGDNVSGGTIARFSSTGIDDKASSCRLTIMDAGTVFENTLYAPRTEIKGDAIIDGNLIVKGIIPRESQTYQNIIDDVGVIAKDTYDRVFAKLQTESFDISNLTIGHRNIIEGDTLTSAIINSNLRRVGILQDLQTNGESLLSETLYTSNKRVGINTMDPNMALSIWDEEVNINIGKHSKDTALITTRANNLILGVNLKKNITLSSDGDVAIQQLKLGNMTFGTSPSAPDYNAIKGTVVFNENPSLGGPLGWVSLGDARWANFGIID